MSNKPICVFESPAFTRSGYGDWAISIGKSLLRYDKFDVHVLPTQWGACSKKNLESEIADPVGKMLLDKVLKGPLQKQPELYIKVSIPNEFMPHGKYNIGITAGIESTVPPAPWIEGLNRMNLNFVLSKHVQDVFAGANYTKRNPNGSTEELVVKTPMEILHWGANTKAFYKTDEKVASVEEALAHIHEPFNFLFVGQWTHGNMQADRKAIGYLIKTFLETFADVPNPPGLILKTSGAQICVMDRYDCINKITEVTNMVKSQKGPNVKLPNVYLLHGELNDTEMNGLYNHEKVKVHVSFTHGEGGGHPLLLSTLSGKPLLAPKWSGHLDYLNPKYARYFDGSLVPIPDSALNDWFVKEARWFDVDYEAAGLKLKHYFHNYNEKVLADAEALRAENAVKFDELTIDKEFHAMLDKHLPKFAVEAPISLPPLKKLNLPKVVTSDYVKKITQEAIDKTANIDPTEENYGQIIDIFIKHLATKLDGMLGRDGVIKFNGAYAYLKKYWDENFHEKAIAFVKENNPNKSVRHVDTQQGGSAIITSNVNQTLVWLTTAEPVAAYFLRKSI